MQTAFVNINYKLKYAVCRPMNKIRNDKKINVSLKEAHVCLNIFLFIIFVYFIYLLLFIIFVYFIIYIFLYI